MKGPGRAALGLLAAAVIVSAGVVVAVFLTRDRNVVVGDAAFPSAMASSHTVIPPSRSGDEIWAGVKAAAPRCQNCRWRIWACTPTRSRTAGRRYDLTGRKSTSPAAARVTAAPAVDRKAGAVALVAAMLAGIFVRSLRPLLVLAMAGSLLAGGLALWTARDAEPRFADARRDHVAAGLSETIGLGSPRSVPVWRSNGLRV
jgi:hypothetical protein